MKMINRILVAGALACTAFGAAADNYPSRPIKWVVPFTPGGAMDSMARTLGEKMAQSMGQPVVIENRPGAGGTIGSSMVAKADPDGYTMMIVSIGHAVNPALYPKLSYDGIKSFEPVSLVGIVPNVLVAHSAAKFNSVNELIAQARRSRARSRMRRPAPGRPFTSPPSCSIPWRTWTFFTCLTRAARLRSPTCSAARWTSCSTRCPPPSRISIRVA